MVIKLGILEATALICRSCQIFIQDLQSRIEIKTDGTVEIVPLQGSSGEYAITPRAIANESTMPDFTEWVKLYTEDGDMVEFQENVVRNTDDQKIIIKAEKGFDIGDYQMVTVSLEDEGRL